MGIMFAPVCVSISKADSALLKVQKDIRAQKLIQLRMINANGRQEKSLIISVNKNLTLSTRIFYTSSKSVRSRVMTFLSAQAVKNDNMEFTIPFNRQQMADYLNLDRSALSKELCRMRDEGILSFRKNKFRLYKIEQ